MHDVIIIGGGPSGLNAARKLTETGLDVLILEKKKAVGNHIVCTGIVGSEVFNEFSLSPSPILKDIKKIKWISPNGDSFVYDHPRPFAHVVDRKKFDRNLLYDAQSKGASVKCYSQVIDISVNNSHVEVISRKEGKFREKHLARLALIATGVNYKLHKKLGLGYPKDFLNGVQAELKLNKVDCTHVFVGRDVAPGAFAWAVPIDGDKVRLGLMTDKSPKEYFGRILKRFYPEGGMILDKGRIQFKAIAQGLVSPTYVERVLTIGEAAGQVKTTTGGGIYFGLICSEIASRVVQKAFKKADFSTSVLTEYEKSWKRAIQKEILVGYYARKICAKINDNQIEKMFRIAKNDGVIPLIKERGDFDWHGGLVIALIKKIPFREFIKSKFSGFCFKRN